MWTNQLTPSTPSLAPQACFVGQGLRTYVHRLEPARSQTAARAEKKKKRNKNLRAVRGPTIPVT